MAEHTLDVFLPYTSPELIYTPRASRRPAETFQFELLELREEYKDTVICTISDIQDLTPNTNEKPEVVDIIAHGGIDQLPLVYVDDTLVFQGQYPDIQEMRDTLDSL